MKKPILSSLLLGFLLVFTMVPYAHAAIAPGSISVSPAHIDAEVSLSAPEQTIVINITNSYASPVTLVPSLQSIDLDNANLTPNGPLDSALTNNLLVDTKNLIVAANSSTSLSITFRNSTELSPGGHYAALLLTSKDSAVGSLNYHSAISISLFLVKRGGERQSVQLAGINESHFLFTLPKDVLLTFKNDGNVHIVPRASVTILKKSQLDIYAKGVANQNSIPVFPGKTLTSDVKLASLKTAWLPGRYSLRIQTRADDIDGSEVSTKTFYYLPPLFISICSLSLLMLIAMIVGIIKLPRRKDKLRLGAKNSSPTIESDKVHVRVIKRVKVKIDEP